MKRILTLFLFLGVFSSLFGATIEERLKQVSLHDRICMKRFFDFAIKIDQAAHVLCFDNKPVCFTGVVIKDKHKTFQDILCLKGWYAFKKHEDLFPHPNFIFNEKKREGDNLKLLDIFIINKRALIKCLQKHEYFFKKKISQDFTPERFISQLENGSSITSLIQDDEMLLGVLLGFGEESSRAFKEQQNNYTGEFGPQWTNTYSGIEAKQPKGCKIYSVGFMGNPKSEEVKNLLSTYDTELEEIWAMYRKYKDPLRMTLEQLCAD